MRMRRSFFAQWSREFGRVLLEWWVGQVIGFVVGVIFIMLQYRYGLLARESSMASVAMWVASFVLVAFALFGPALLVSARRIHNRQQSELEELRAASQALGPRKVLAYLAAFKAKGESLSRLRPLPTDNETEIRSWLTRVGDWSQQVAGHIQEYCTDEAATLFEGAPGSVSNWPSVHPNVEDDYLTLIRRTDILTQIIRDPDRYLRAPE